MSKEELVKALRDIADAIDEDFINCLFSIHEHRLVLPDHEAFQAILCGLYKSNPKFYRRVTTTPGYLVHDSIRDAGWIDPNISLENGLGVMLQKGWPTLYEKVLEGRITPFEALLETDHVHPLHVYEALTKNAQTRKVDGEQLEPAEQVDEADEELLQEMEDL
jgi:hypothetical protein